MTAETDLTATIRDAAEQVHALRAEVDQRVTVLEAQLGTTARDILEAQHEARRLLSLAKRAAQQLAEANGTTVASEYARAFEGTDVTPIEVNTAPPAWPVRTERREHPDLARMDPAKLARRYRPKG